MPRWWALAIGLPLASTIDPRRLWWPVAACLALGLLWAAVSVVPDGLLEMFFLALLCLTAVATAGVDDLDPVLSAFGWGLAISSVLCAVQSFGWSPVDQVSAPAGLFLNSEVLAETAAPALVWAVLRPRFALAVFLAVPVALCHSRVAVIVVAGGLLCGLPWRLMAASLAMVAILSVLSLFTLGVDKFGSGVTRLVLWVAAYHSLTPLGRGIGWWAAAHPQPYEEFVHSDGLQLLVELGIGSLFFLAVPLLALYRANDARAERAAFAACCAAAAVSFPIRFPAGGFLFAALAGHLARARPRVHVPRPARRAGPVAGVGRPVPRSARVGDGRA